MVQSIIAADNDCCSARSRLLVGGWLHVHGNVPVKEKEQWSQWLCQSLYAYTVAELERIKASTSESSNTTADTDWVVICHHVEKVKSFAPTVNHYVADVFLGPRRLAQRRAHPQIQQHHLQHDDESYLQQLDTIGSHHQCSCYVYDTATGVLAAVPPAVSPPSCALSARARTE